MLQSNFVANDMTKQNFVIKSTQNVNKELALKIYHIIIWANISQLSFVSIVLYACYRLLVRNIELIVLRNVEISVIE